MADLPDVSDVLGSRPTDQPGADSILGPRPPEQPLWTGPEADEFTAAAEPFGRVLRAFGQGAETAWDHGENLGYSDDVNEALKKAGVYADQTKSQGGVMRAWNEAIMRPAVSTVFGLPGLFGRATGALVAGAQGAVAQAGEEVGAPGLGRDIAALPEAFPLFGEETGGLRGVPVPARGELLGRELGGALSSAEIDHAAELGVIGPAGADGWRDTGYTGSVGATQGSITPEVQARVRTMQETARADAADGKPPAEAPLAPTDIHEAARSIAPDTFAAYDPLVQKVDELRGQIADAQTELRRNAEAQAPHQAEIADLQDRLEDTTPRLAKKYEARLANLIPERDAFLNDDFTMGALTRETPDIQALREQLQRVDYQMRDLAPDVTAAYREAAKQFPETQVQPEAAPGAQQYDQPPVAPGMTRLYHGSGTHGRYDGQAWFSTDMRYARDYRAGGELQYVDYPTEKVNAALDPDNYGQTADRGFVWNAELDASETGLRRPLPKTGETPAEPSPATPEAPPRMAVDATATPAVEPAAVARPAAAEPTPEQPPINIREDVTAKLMGAGRPEEEARASAELVGAHYESRAERFGGEKGTAAELYRDEAPEIVEGKTRARVPEMAQQTTRGKIRLTDGRAVISLMKDANASTFIHETGHAWLEELLRDTKDTRAPADLVADGSTVRRWLGAGPEADITTAQHEKFARGFERYMMEGTAPSRKLDGVFAQFKSWLSAIYQTVQRLRSPIDGDIRQVFDRLLATPTEPATIAPEREVAGHASVPQPKTPYLPAGREPTRLIGFLRRKTVQFPGTMQERTIPGGLRDPGGDISSMIGGPKGMPGLINNATGSSIRDAMTRAWENGYFPEYPDKTKLGPDDDRLLLDRMSEDLGGNPQYSAHDQDAVDKYNAAIEHNAEIDRLASEHDIDPKGMTRDQFFDAVMAKMTAEEQARATAAADAELAARFDEVTAETREWLADHDIPWDSEGFFGLDEPRTLADLEAERGSEGNSRQPIEGDEDHADATPAPGDQGQGEAGGGPRGREPGTEGRAAPETAGGSADTDPTERPSPHTATEDQSDLVDKAGNIRLDNLNSPDDVKQVLRDLAERNDDFMAGRGGVIPDAQRRAMADGLGLTPETFLPQKPDAVSPSVWAEAVQKLTYQASDEVARIGKLAGESGSPQDLAAYLSAKQRLLMIADHFSTITAEAGRTLRVFDKAGIKFTGDMVAMMERDTGKTLYQMQQEAKAVGALDTVAQRSKMAQDTRELTGNQKFKAGVISYFINNLISGPITHAAYSVGNTVTALFKAVPLTLTEASIDTARAALSAEPLADRVYFGEIGAQIYAGARGAWDGFSPGWKAFKTGISYMEGADRLAEEAGGKQLPGMSPAGETALRTQTIPGPVGYALETPSRAVQAIHTVFYSMNYEREIARRAFRMASNEGLAGDAFATRVAMLTQDPPINLVQAAHDEAMQSVLMKRPAYGTIQQKFVSAINDSLPLKLAMPFMQVGMNILDEGLIKDTPLGLASQTVRDNLFGRNGEVMRTQQYARIMVGTGVAAGVVAAAAQGVLTGAGPTDRKERALKEADGWKAYSIRLGDTYVPYRKYLGPLGPLVGGAASIYDVGHLLSQGDITKAAGSAILGFSETVADETWMSGLSELIDATKHWDTDGEKYLRNLALNFMPFSVGASQVARMVDQYQREVHSWTDAARNHLPGLSEGLMPQRDWTGTPIGSHTMMSPSVFLNDRTMQAMEAAEMYPAKMMRDVRGVPLNDQQYDDLSRVAGKLAKQRMDMLVNTPGFLSLPLGMQREQMRQTLTASRKVGEDWLMLQPGNENIIRQATDAKSAQMQGRLPEDVRAARRGSNQ